MHVLVESVAGTKSGVQTMSERRYPGSGREGNNRYLLVREPGVVRKLKL